MNEPDLPTFDDLVDYVVRDLRSIGSLMHLQNAWQDLRALVRGTKVFREVYVSTIEGIVIREIERLSDDLLACLWKSSAFIVDRGMDMIPGRSQLMRDLTRRAFAVVYSRASHEPWELARD